MRAAVLGAFPFPYPQGSQVFVTDHSRALMRAGVGVALFTYGQGEGPVPEDLESVASPRWLSPRAMRSGPTWAKFPADAALLATYIRASRAEKFDVAFAHNAEAAVIAIAARKITGTPVIYLAHTILEHELSAYGSDRFSGTLCRVGRRIDRLIARRADGIVALCNDARADLSRDGKCPIEVIAPGLVPAPPPEAKDIAEACGRHALECDGYALYCGNMDGYQDLDLLAQAARSMKQGCPDGAPQLVVASHDISRLPDSFRGVENLICVAVDDFAQTRALIAGAQSLVLCRRRRGGFPIKLLNYMEARKPIVAFSGVAPGFTHMRNAWLLGPGAGGKELADGLIALAQQRELREALGEGARQLLERDHEWALLAQRTRAFAEDVVARGSNP